MSSSSDLETGIAQQVSHKKAKRTKKNTKTKPKTKARETATAVASIDSGRNEGDNDPHWAYEPPNGAVLLDHTVDVGAFEWDTIDDASDTEIWLVRVPDTIKAKHLNRLEIDPPSSSRTARVGNLTRKHAKYDVWSIGVGGVGGGGGGDDDADDVAEDVAAAEELRGLSCLLPRRSKAGKLYIAPKPVSRHIVVTARPSVATPAEQTVYQNPPRASYPKDVLKHSFVPYGARSERTEPGDPFMNVDDDQITVEKPTSAAPKDKPSKKSKESKGKKRKVEGDSPKTKKSKKHKTST